MIAIKAGKPGTHAVSFNASELKNHLQKRFSSNSIELKRHQENESIVYSSLDFHDHSGSSRDSVIITKEKFPLYFSEAYKSEIKKTCYDVWYRAMRALALLKQIDMNKLPCSPEGVICGRVKNKSI